MKPRCCKVALFHLQPTVSRFNKRKVAAWIFNWDWAETLGQSQPHLCINRTHMALPLPEPRSCLCWSSWFQTWRWSSGTQSPRCRIFWYMTQHVSCSWTRAWLRSAQHDYPPKMEHKQTDIPRDPEARCPGSGWTFLCGSCSWLQKLWPPSAWSPRAPRPPLFWHLSWRAPPKSTQYTSWAQRLGPIFGSFIHIPLLIISNMLHRQANKASIVNLNKFEIQHRT